MSKNNPKGKARRMSHAKPASDYNQFTAVGQRDRWSKCPDVKKQRSNKDNRCAQELRSSQMACPTIMRLQIRRWVWLRSRRFLPIGSSLRLPFLGNAAAHSLIVSQTAFPAKDERWERIAFALKRLVSAVRFASMAAT